MSLEIHIDWQGQPDLVGKLFMAERGSSASFEYDPDWLRRADTFAIDPTALPLQRGLQHAGTLFGAIHDCGPDRWGRILIERAVRKKVLPQKPYNDIDYVLASHIPRQGNGSIHPGFRRFVALSSGKISSTGELVKMDLRIRCRHNAMPTLPLLLQNFHPVPRKFFWTPE